MRESHKEAILRGIIEILNEKSNNFNLGGFEVFELGFWLIIVDNNIEDYLEEIIYKM